MTTAVAPTTATSQVSPATTPEARRTRFEAELALAARVIPTARPLGAFVGLNPLAGLEHEPWADATRLASRSLGVRTTLSEDVMRSASRSGRISTSDLEAAIAAVLPEPHASVTVGERQATRLQIVLDDLQHGPLDPAPQRRARTLSEALVPEIAAQVDRRTARWCAAFVDEGQATWSLPRREQGLFRAWRAVGPHEPGIPPMLRQRLLEAPSDPADAVIAALDALGVPDADVRRTLEAHLAAQPGWAAHMRWREAEGQNGSLLDLLAVRLTQEAALLGRAVWRPSLAAPLAASDRLSSRDRAAELLSRWRIGFADGEALEVVSSVLASVPVGRSVIWQEAYERGYRTHLLQRMDAEALETPQTAAAQVVCCIDPRSESLRRHLEAAGEYETFGFAGFFGVAMSFVAAGDEQSRAQCPVPVAPSAEIHDHFVGAAGNRAQRRQARRRGLRAALHAAHGGGVGAFALAEMGGVLAAPLAVARTLAPGLTARAAGRPEPSSVAISLDHIPLETRATMAEGILRGIGLTDGFAPLVVFCGHESDTVNNPYANALACGACGGHGGAPNARVAAALVNDPEVRVLLRAQGIEIPETTRAIAALHETVTDRVEILDADGADAETLAELERGFDVAGRASAEERSASLPGSAPSVRGRDWAQVFPEWGLAGNAALVVGPRKRTRGVDLERRTFLHSYDAASDPEGAVLEAILTAPLVVAQGLNAQYFASASDPVHLGSGTKAVHNVVGGVGVMSAAGGDLLQGLPWQSVADGERLVHEPMRLLVLVEAPPERIAAIVGRHANVRQLIDGEWVRLLARTDPSCPWQRLKDGVWTDASETTDLTSDTDTN